ncbi:MAG: PEGA domain-containing protein [Opitutales bacterium]
MTPNEAAQILDLTADATAEQAEARYLELQQRLENKIAKAPTPGLQAKYRESLSRVTEAFEALTLAADGDTLPVLERRPNTPEQAKPPEPFSDSIAAPAAKPTAKGSAKGNREFLVVALIAVLLLGAGGWWIVHIRAESAERTRIEAAAAAEAEQRAAEQARLERESALAAEAEFARLRAAQAEAKIRWETIEREAGAAERRLSEIRNDARTLDRLPAPDQAELRARIAAQEAYVRWVNPYLTRHPVRTELARLDALLSARAIEEATVTEQALMNSLAQADEEVAAQQKALLALTKLVEITSNPSELTAKVTDAYGRTHTFETPIRAEFPIGPLEVVISPASYLYADFERTAQVSKAEDLLIHAHFERGRLLVTSEPDGIAFKLWDERDLMFNLNTPQNLVLPTGEWALTVMAPGWAHFEQYVTVKDHEITEVNAVFESGGLALSSEPSGLAYQLTNSHGFSASGNTPAHVEGIPSGPVTLAVSRPGWNTQRKELTIISNQIVEQQVAFVGSDLTISSMPSGAEVYENGKQLGVTPLVLQDVIPSDKSYVLRKEGYTSIELKTSLTAGQAKTETVTLSPSTPVTIYVFRPIHILAGGASVGVFANNQYVGYLLGGRYGKLTTSPGILTLYASDGVDAKEISVNCSPGSTLYYHIQPTLSSMRLDRVSDEVGKSALSKYRKAWDVVQ